MAERVRPQIHFTVAQGWINDPHGLVWDGSKYHMFYQYVPGQTSWDSALLWGHAVSDDLVTWTEIEPAIYPVDEVGCWSGSVVIDNGTPYLFYTRPTEGKWSDGSAVGMVGSPDLKEWTRFDGPALVTTPEGLVDFRDPQVRRDGDRWTMVVGAGEPGFGGVAVQYHSTDLRHWESGGIFARRSAAEREPIYTGTVWECPQFLNIDDTWVLIVSAMENEIGFHQVMYATGDYNGVEFTATKYGVFGAGLAAYATTTFADRDGRACAMSWIKEKNDKTPEGSAFAGAQSVVSVLHVATDGRLVLAPHPSVVGALEWASVEADVARSSDAVVAVHGVVSARSEFIWTCDNVAISVDGETGVMQVHCGEELLGELHAAEAAGDFYVVIDADIIEVWWTAAEGSVIARV